MNLLEKVGQRFMLSFDGTELTPTLRAWLLECRPGGVILFGRNIKSIEQVNTLTANLQDLAARNGLPPFIIALDEEGGRVSRMSADGSSWIAPSQMAQAAAGIEAVRASAKVTARRLQRMGINLNFAPVADINNNPHNPVIGIRSYGSDPAIVAELVACAIAEYNAVGVGSCVKHFPGHGDTGVDSHFGLPVISHTRERLDAVELVPFRRAFAANVPALMTAHVMFPALEQAVPVTLSRKFLTELLREELGFGGLVFTDALDMKAIAERYTPAESALATLRAGADVVLPCFTMEIQRAAIRQTVRAASENAFELEEGLQRVLSFKERFCKPVSRAYSLEDLNQEAIDAQTILVVARKSLTLVSIREGFEFGKQAESPVVIDFTLPSASPVEEGRQAAPLLRTLLSEYWENLRYLTLPAQPSTEQIALSCQLAQTTDNLTLLVRNATRNESQVRALQELVKIQPNTVAVAVRDPYDLTLAKGAASLATYGDPPCSVRALAEVLLGKLKPTGKLPVRLEEV
ncbi:beta-N-acetylhexosaminidase [Candidatus Chlorohelix sp.]|uniref:beta-N-acetylhexosaminidase n=1 Tax=Candidatus Chlorohelix sp. TaxID=3139201 RepID=UPI00304E59E3